MASTLPALTPDRPDIEGYKHGRVPRELREQQLLDVAEEVFTELGYDAASIEEVTRRAGIKRPLIYTYFGGKEGLYLACYRRARSELDEHLARGADQPVAPGRTAMDNIIHAYFRFLASSPSRWDMLYGPGAAIAGPVADEIAALRHKTVELLADVLRGYMPPEVDDLTVLAYTHAASGSGEQLARWWRRTPEIPIDRLAEIAARYILAGLELPKPPD
jgi:AcrR family transcriptional regulator